MRKVKRKFYSFSVFNSNCDNLHHTLHFAALYVLQLYFTFCSTLHFATLRFAALLYVLQHFTFCGPTPPPAGGRTGVEPPSRRPVSLSIVGHCV